MDVDGSTLVNATALPIGLVFCSINAHACGIKHDIPWPAADDRAVRDSEHDDVSMLTLYVRSIDMNCPSGFEELKQHY